ncbi:TetR/AcrR family transcriptional regulator [bacterium]|nr:TetR/AcrR family transcriptional regulator [bacterium]
MAKKRTRSSADASQEKILQAAIALFARHGLDQTSFAQIARACGLSQANILYHFQSKERLIQAMILKIVANNRATVATYHSPKSTPREQLTHYFRGNLEWGLKFPDETRVILLMYYYASFQPAFRELYDQILYSARERLETCLEGIQREERLKLQTSVKATAQILHDWLLGTLINFTTAGKKSATTTTLMKEKWDVLLSSLLR